MRKNDNIFELVQNKIENMESNQYFEPILWNSHLSTFWRVKSFFSRNACFSVSYLNADEKEVV